MDAKTANRVASAPPVLLWERDGSIATLILNRPAARNSLSEALLGELAAAFTKIAADRAVRAVVLAANGPAFCAGHDLKELTGRRGDADRGRAYFRHIMTICSAMMQQIVNLPQPVIAAVQGAASAAGCQLVASCDLAIASSAAKFATPGVVNFAAEDATARSQVATSWQPAALAAPCTAAMTGCGKLTICCIIVLHIVMILVK